MKIFQQKFLKNIDLINIISFFVTFPGNSCGKEKTVCHSVTGGPIFMLLNHHKPLLYIFA